ncbi:gliding motility-associated ABC transporter ATP-binding subunit GldA [Roseivirga misakiensis]|uniref:Gliding motility-associated ABC transporter ATP-binding subunit GldA n=1 Tax=Roseivirga misakiensis TaxID=1563681 RepID=A0A1E5SK64_9BACT|nr:gliding motility-associated ABC transporter ATP-binding subunit GldA [Roseivirga misakiensis]OEJ99514.1 gliding motility-associated ABC transporter ATP-binding subunit GldA [Roseivirga misakiensis]
MSIKVSQLTKVYGNQKAVNEISFEVNRGDILGFLGPNGAGKSTTMKIATGFLPPSEGVIEIEGLDVTKEPIDARKCIGYLPEHNPLYLDMYVHEYLSFIGELHGLRGSRLKERVKEMIVLCGLVVEQNKRISALSKGYRQRVGLAQALIHDPSVLILDEPTTGLDPNQLVEIRHLIKEISQNKTVILSTHIMQEVKALCTRVIIINKGEIVADDTVENLTGGQYVLRIEFQGAISTEALESFGAVRSLGDGLYEINHDGKQELRPQLFELAKANDWVILSMQQQEKDLEQVFRNLTQET